MDYAVKLCLCVLLILSGAGIFRLCDGVGYYYRNIFDETPACKDQVKEGTGI